MPTSDKNDRGQIDDLVDDFVKNFDGEAIYYAIAGAMFREGGTSACELYAEAIEPNYEAVIGKLRPLIGVLPKLTKAFMKDLKPMLAAAVQASITMKEDEELVELSRRHMELEAQRTKRRLNAYLREGFTREEAFSILMKDEAVKDKNDIGKIIATAVSESISSKKKPKTS